MFQFWFIFVGCLVFAVLFFTINSKVAPGSYPANLKNLSVVVISLAAGFGISTLLFESLKTYLST